MSTAWKSKPLTKVELRALWNAVGCMKLMLSEGRALMSPTQLDLETARLATAKRALSKVYAQRKAANKETA